MLYAKIDEDGNVAQFPYRLDLSKIITEDAPEDAVEVDVSSLRPETSWNQRLLYNEVVKNIDGTYALSYTKEAKFSAFEDKQKWIKIAIGQNKKQNEKIFKNKVTQLKFGYQEEEILSWDQQSTEAKAYLSDNDASVPLIEKMSENRKLDLLQLANRIIEKNNFFKNAYGDILGKYQKNNDILDSIDLDDETTFDNIDLYGWN